MYKCECGEIKNYFGLPFQTEPYFEGGDLVWHDLSDMKFCSSHAQAGCLHHKEKENENTMVNNNELFSLIRSFVTEIHDLIDELDQDLAVMAELGEAEEGTSPIIVQGRLRGDVLHLQRGGPGDYTTADVSLRMSQAEVITNSVPDSTSFAGTGRAYLIGVEYPDGSVTIGGVALSDPFGTNGPQTSTSRR